MNISFTLFSQEDLSYFLPLDEKYDDNIPKPSEVLGFNVGDWHINHDKLIDYLTKLSKSSKKIKIENRGYTYEDRPLILLTITSEKNHSRLEELRKNHINLSNKALTEGDLKKMPAVVYQGFSVHGNEASGSNAAILLAYYLATSEDEKVLELLENLIILLDPSLNPDGLQRFSGWVNSQRSHVENPDSYDREYNEVWPGGRTNHYWFDLNRDWLTVQLNESKARILSFNKWLPNILTDHHEMGKDQSFFFQPGIPSSVNPLISKKNQSLTSKISKFHAKELDEIGSLYYSKEDYDDFFLSKGSAYPDINGGIGILFEQASSRGYSQNTENGLLTFPFSIRNQFKTAISTLKAANSLKVELLKYQIDFFSNSKLESEKKREKAIVFGNKKDISSTYKLLEVLRFHNIEIHNLKNDITINEKKFSTENSFIVPLKQNKFKIIQAIFDKQKKFKDSTFYDVSSWTIPIAYDVNFEKINNLKFIGGLIQDDQKFKVKKVEKADYAYVFETHGYYYPKGLYKLLDYGIRAKVSLKKFKINNKSFDYGTIMVPSQNQNLNSDEIHKIMSEISVESELDIYSTNTGASQEGIDLGSRNFKTIKKPNIGLLVGDGVRSYDAGEIWYIMDRQYNMPITKIDTRILGKINFEKYTHFIFPSFSGELSDKTIHKINSWIKKGGTLILFREAVNWAKENQLVEIDILENELKAENINFINRKNFKTAQSVSGAIFKANLDRTHPINFGIENNSIALFRNTNIFLKPDDQSYNNPIKYDKNPLISGYISKENLKTLSNTVPFKIESTGDGKVIIMTDNTNFRGYWIGTQHFMANMIFYSQFMN
ncbi:MAG: M14 family zinc carboxypeptidase [Flavobacteriaceae bacterium]